MANGLLSKVFNAAAACVRLPREHRHRLRRDRKLVPAVDHEEPPCTADEGKAEGEDDGLWRRAILMGERCKPLDFPGVIHYDSFGRRLSAPPLPRGGKAALHCRSTYDVDEAAIVATRKAT